MIPVNEAKSPCIAHGCALCCYETEMPVTSRDIARLEAKGFDSKDFVELDESGFVVLRNVPATLPDEGHHCFFLKDNRCSVYADRPDGCRWYPVIVNPQRRVLRDEECPHRHEFPIPAGAERRLHKLLGELEKDASRRR